MNDNWLVKRLRGLHANQSGAVAFMVLCAILMALMLALVIYDTTPAARQKLEVQTAADTAAWSQSSVEARSMNMIAFANIGKRIIMGQTLFYQMLWIAWAEILAITIIALIVAIVACFFGVGCAFVDKLVITLANVVTIMALEATDLASFFAKIIPRAREDVEALDKYQVHFQGLTPWWGWGESWRRGLRNGAYVSGWPVPNNALSSFGSVPLIGNVVSSGLTDELPIERYPDLGELCIRSLIPDLPIHVLDYAAQTALCSGCTTDKPTGGIPRVALYAAAGVLATVQYAANCAVEFVAGKGFLSLTFGSDWLPFQLKTPGNEADWYRMTSNMAFAYRPGRDFAGEMRGKYDFLRKDYDAGLLSQLYKSDGFLGMARSEISYQNGDPDMWHPSWSTRMRPVALPGEWSAYSGDFRMLSAFNDTVPYLAGGAAVGAILSNLGGLGGGTNMGTPDPWDILRAEVAFDAMTDSYVEGVAR